jgi:hypothetical protein
MEMFCGPALYQQPTDSNDSQHDTGEIINGTNPTLTVSKFKRFF